MRHQDKPLGMGFPVGPGSKAKAIKIILVTLNMALVYTFFQAFDVTNKNIENKREISVYDI
jgi:hypothetical protein